MVKHIVFLPSDKKIIASKGQTLLQIGLSAGLKLHHSCSNGTCGECKAKHITGALLQLKVGDYGFSDQQISVNTILMCCHEPDWESADACIEIETVEQGQQERIGFQTMEVMVTRLETAGPDYVLLYCKTPRNNGLRFFAGQRVDVRTEQGDSCRLALANCPCDGRFLEFHIPINNARSFSIHIQKLRKGSKLILSGPYGNDVFSEYQSLPVVFIAYEQGFSAINSVIEYAQALELEIPQTLFRFSRNGRGHYRANLCHAWEDALDNFSYVECMEPISDCSQLRQAGLKIKNYLNHELDEAHYYLALPRLLIDTMIQLLQESGVSIDQIHNLYESDRFI